MTPAAIRALAMIAAPSGDDDYPTDEIIQEGIEAMIGLRRIHVRTVNELLGVTAISECSFEGGARRFRINDTGRSLLRRPELEGEIFAALRARGSFTIKNDKLIPMDEP